MSTNASEGDELSAIPQSDFSLVRQLQSGTGDAASELYLRYAKRLRGLAKKQTSADLAKRIEPDDIVQSVFRTFFRRVHTSDYTVPEGKELWGLLLVIALNKVRQAAVFHRAARRDVRKTGSTEDVSNLGFLVSGEGDDEQALAVLQMVIAELVQKLPPAKQEMIRLRIDGHEVDEIATQTQRSKRTVERTLQEFREQLAKALEMNIEGEGEHVRPGDES